MLGVAMPASRRRLICGLFGLCVAGLGDPSEARGRVRFRGRGIHRGTSHDGPILSKEELRFCMAQQNHLNDISIDIDRNQAALNLRATRIKELEQSITAKEPLVDQYSETSVNNFNALVGSHEQMVREYNSLLPPINARVDEHKTAVQLFNKACADHAYYEDDMRAIQTTRK